MIKGISHAAFSVADMQRSLDFYCGVLGLEDAFETRDEQSQPWIRYLKIRPGQFLELFYFGDGRANEGSYSHLCLEVEDIQSAYEQIVGRGIAPDTPVRRGKDQNWQFWIHDPDGNRIELMQMVPESPQSRCSAL